MGSLGDYLSAAIPAPPTGPIPLPPTLAAVTILHELRHTWAEEEKTQRRKGWIAKADTIADCSRQLQEAMRTAFSFPPAQPSDEADDEPEPIHRLMRRRYRTTCGLEVTRPVTGGLQVKVTEDLHGVTCSDCLGKRRLPPVPPDQPVHFTTGWAVARCGETVRKSNDNLFTSDEDKVTCPRCISAGIANMDREERRKLLDQPAYPPSDYGSRHTGKVVRVDTCTTSWIYMDVEGTHQCRLMGHKPGTDCLCDCGTTLVHPWRANGYRSIGCMVPDCHNKTHNHPHSHPALP